MDPIEQLKAEVADDAATYYDPATRVKGMSALPPSEPQGYCERSRLATCSLPVGKPITVVYTIKDPTEWRKTNPLCYAHDGLEAYCVSIGDLSARRDELRAALERIADEGDRESRNIARAALDSDDRSRLGRRQMSAYHHQAPDGPAVVAELEKYLKELGVK